MQLCSIFIMREWGGSTSQLYRPNGQFFCLLHFGKLCTWQNRRVRKRVTLLCTQLCSALLKYRSP